MRPKSVFTPISFCFECATPFVLSPDGSRLAVVHSTAYLPPQLAVVNSDGSDPHELTDTRTPGYKALAALWVDDAGTLRSSTSLRDRILWEAPDAR